MAQRADARVGIGMWWEGFLQLKRNIDFILSSLNLKLPHHHIMFLGIDWSHKPAFQETDKETSMVFRPATFLNKNGNAEIQAAIFPKYYASKAVL